MSVKNVETLAVEIYRECEKDGEPVTMEEAREMAAMEAKASESRHYEKSVDTVKKARKPKPRKVDTDKLFLLSTVKETLNENGIEEVTMVTETALNFSFNGENYTLKLTKHRS